MTFSGVPVSGRQPITVLVKPGGEAKISQLPAFFRSGPSAAMSPLANLRREYCYVVHSFCHRLPGAASPERMCWGADCRSKRHGAARPGQELRGLLAG